MNNEPLLVVRMNDASGGAAIDQDRIADVLDFAYRSKRKTPAVIDILVAGDLEMARLNRRHLNKDTPTDVLAFDDGEDEDGRIRLGDIAVGFEVAMREAGERGVPFADELLFYALHGLFHLLGMRDDDDAERAEMHKAQAKAMRDFGIEIADNFF
jgi:metalloprotein, YbeY/UPF0054 family